MPASDLKKQLSESFAQQLVMPPALDQIAPEALAAMINNNTNSNSQSDKPLALRVIDVRQASEFDAGHVRGAVNLPMDAFDPDALAKSVAEDCANGSKPLLVFVSSQSPDIDGNCALSFVRSWEELGFEQTTGVAGAAIAASAGAEEESSRD